VCVSLLVWIVYGTGQSLTVWYWARCLVLLEQLKKYRVALMH
jgi:hypothetical protein